jgi:phospholipase/carboxylesterase
VSLETYDHGFAPAAAAGAPTIVLLHGTGGDRRSFDAFGAALAPGAARLALDGDADEGGMRRFFRRRAEGVYDMDDLARRTEAFDAFLAAAFAKYRIDPAGAVGLGYSNGANLLANHAFLGRGRFRRLALAHPLIPFDPGPLPDLSGLAVLITAGRRDPIAPAALTERLAGALGAAGATVETIWGQGGHEVGPEEAAALAAFLRAPASAPV